MFSFDEPNGMLHLLQLLGQPSSLSLSLCVCVKIMSFLNLQEIIQKSKPQGKILVLK
jgi:hypothetical protein